MALEGGHGVWVCKGEWVGRGCVRGGGGGWVCDGEGGMSTVVIELFKRRG